MYGPPKADGSTRGVCRVRGSWRLVSLCAEEGRTGEGVAAASGAVGYLESTVYNYSPYSYVTNIVPGLPLAVIVENVRPIHTRSDRNDDFGVFAQDRWTMDKVTLNLGVQFDAGGRGPDDGRGDDRVRGTSGPRRTYHIVRTAYCATKGSGVRMAMPWTIAWQISMRSNGSR